MTADATIDVVIADDHPVIREGLKHRLERRPDIRVVGEAADGPGLFTLLSEISTPRVLVLDMSMPDFVIREAMPILRARYPKMKILILTVHNDQRNILQMIDAGVDGYLIKGESMDTYIPAVRKVAAGERFFSQDTFSVALEDAKTPTPSPRELEVLALIAQDATTDEIARRLDISPRTVDTHVRRACQKLGVSGRAAAVAKAVQLGYVKAME
jgi:NarL family two-component system response regulator YdfI